jgi:TRAP-type transport system periplasmic protein
VVGHFLQTKLPFLYERVMRNENRGLGVPRQDRRSSASVASRFAVGLLAIIAGTVAPSVARATTVIRIGTLAPGNSPWAKEFKKFAADVASDTNGEVELDYQWNGQAGDEALMIQKLRVGQLDAAGVTAMGLAQTGVMDVLLFELPGLFTSWQKLDMVRAAIKDDLDKEFEAKGFTVLGWGDFGAAKTMTVGFEVHRPSDLRGKGVFLMPGDPFGPKIYSIIGGMTPRTVPFPEILPGLQTGAITVLVAPPLAAEQLQWASRITHISTETLGYGVGAVIASSARVNMIPPKWREVFERRGREVTERLNRTVRNMDEQAYARMKATKVTYSPTDADRAEWRDIFLKVGQQLRGTVFTPALFDKAVRLADNPLVPKD